MTGALDSPSSAKRIKLDHTLPLPVGDLEASQDPSIDAVDLEEVGDSEDEENCSICLQALVDRTVIPKCSHEFCFECLLVWTEQSRRCPLCTQIIGDYLIHSIRSRYDYRKHYLPPLRTSPPPARPAQSNPILQTTRESTRRRRREREWGSRRPGNDESDKLERSIQMRRWIYRHDVYAKHVASNAFTKYRPYPTPAHFSASQELISRTTTFLRRELQVWEGLDVEFLTTLIISLMKSIDIRSESAVKLIAEFLDMDAPYTPGGRHVNAEHFAHEVYCYVRSPYKDLFVYDSVVQYETTRDWSPPPNQLHDHRSGAAIPREHISQAHEEGWSQAGPSSQIPERSESWSPSGRKYSPRLERTNRNAHESHSRQRVSGGRAQERSSTSPRRGDGSRHAPQHTDERISRKRIMDPSHEADASTPPSGKRAAHSSLAQIADQSRQGSRANAKGKERAYDMDVSAESIDCGIDADGGAPSTPVCTSTPGRNISNDVVQPNSSMIPKPPRNISFFDSVKAHLARNDQAAGNLAIRNTNQTLANDQARKEQVQFVPTDDRKDHFTELPPVADHRHSTDSIRLPARARNLERIALCTAPSSADATPDPRAREPLDLEHDGHGRAASASANGTLHADRGPDPDLAPKIHGTKLNLRGAGPLDGQQLISTLNNGADTHCLPATAAPVPAPAPPPLTNAAARAAAPGAAPAVATYSSTARAYAQSVGNARSTPDADDADTDAPPAPKASRRSPAARGAHVSRSHARSPGGHANPGAIALRDQSGAHARAALRARLEQAREEALQGAQGAQVRLGDDAPGRPAGADVKRGGREDAVGVAIDGEAGVGDAQRDAEAARVTEARLKLRVRLAAEKRRAADG